MSKLIFCSIFSNMANSVVQRLTVTRKKELISDLRKGSRKYEKKKF